MLDLPLLSIAQPPPSALQGYHGEHDTPRAPPPEHDDRVPIGTTRPRSPNLRLCRRHLPGG